jgi:hypothetical protein
MGFFKSIGDAIYREYDRRIRRASLVTEYGAQHDGHGHADHDHEHSAEGIVDEHAGAADTAPNVEDEEEAEIVNIPRGTPVSDRKA